MNKTYHIVPLSGGKDSTATALHLKKTYPHRHFIYIFNDTGAELPEIYEMLNKLELRFNMKIKRVNAPTTLKAEMIRKNFLPSPRKRYCTEYSKILPSQRFYKKLTDAGFKIILYLGIRADEQQREGMSEKENIEVRFPLREAGIMRNDVFKMLETCGLGIPNYYNYRTAGGCTFCFFQTQHDWIGMMNNSPAGFKEAKDMELAKKLKWRVRQIHATALVPSNYVFEYNVLPFTWNPKFSLEELENNKELQEQIKAKRKRLLEVAKLSQLQGNLLFADAADEMQASCADISKGFIGCGR